MNTAVPLLPVNPSPLPLPLYEHIKQQISEQILTGALAEGSVLPAEAALAAQFHVAVGTIRRALADLVAEGLLARRRRTGTVVTGRAPQSLRFFFHYFRLHAIDGGLVRSTTTTLGLGRGQAAAAEASAMGQPPGTPVIRIKRLRSVDGAPVMIEDLVVPEARVPGFPRAAEDVPPLLYLYLLRQHGIRVVAVREHLQAGLATAAERTALRLPRPAAVLRFRSTSFDASGQVVLLGQHVADTTRHEYVNETR
jgi:GntR family transcriptional regulator